jgi:hypothetical protein
MISMQKALFGPIADRETSVDLATLAGDGYFICAALLALFWLFLDRGLIFVFPLFAICGYFTRFKHSRAAAVSGVLLGVIGFILWAGPLSSTRVGLLFALSTWIGTRGAIATFKLNGRFHASGQ